jgi:hypothetical protein
MLIYYGYRTIPIAGKSFSEIRCPACSNKESIGFGSISYFHLYRIPIFMTSRKLGIECSRCKKVTTGKEIPKDTSTQLKKLIFPLQRIVFYSIGSILLLLAVGLSSYNSFIEKAKMSELLAAPISNDIYVIDVNKLSKEIRDDLGFEDSHPYIIAKTTGVTDSSIEFDAAKLSYQLGSAASKAISANPEFDKESHFTIKRDQLALINVSGGIYEVKRISK